MKKETLMANFTFLLATVLMRIRGLFRNKKGEVLLTGAKRGDAWHSLLFAYPSHLLNNIPAFSIISKLSTLPTPLKNRKETYT